MRFEKPFVYYICWHPGLSDRVEPRKYLTAQEAGKEKAYWASLGFGDDFKVIQATTTFKEISG